MKTNARFFAPLQKVEKNDNGTLRVWGVASTESVDEAGEVVTSAAMKAALPGFFKHGTGALREMHQPIAAGTVDDAHIDEEGDTLIVATVVDKAAVEKVLLGVYKGFSIGGKVIERDPMKRSIITKLDLGEISLVDRPCNPDAVLDIWKADIAEPEIVDSEADAIEDVTSLPGMAQAIVKASLDHFAKRNFSAEQRRKDAKSGDAMKDGSFPIHDKEDLHNAIRLAGNAKDPAAARAHIKRRAAALGLSSEIPDTWKVFMTDKEAAAKAAVEKAAADKAAADVIAKAAADKEAADKLAAAAIESVEVVDPADEAAKAAAAAALAAAPVTPTPAEAALAALDLAQKALDAKAIPAATPLCGALEKVFALLSEDVAKANAALINETYELAAKADFDEVTVKVAAVVEPVATVDNEALTKALAAFEDAKATIFARDEVLVKMTSGLDALTKRISALELTPLPAKTAGPGAGSLVSVSKGADASGSVAASEAERVSLDTEAVKKYLASLPEDERLFHLMKAAQATPFTPRF